MKALNAPSTEIGRMPPRSVAISVFPSARSTSSKNIGTKFSSKSGHQIWELEALLRPLHYSSVERHSRLANCHVVLSIKAVRFFGSKFLLASKLIIKWCLRCALNRHLTSVPMRPCALSYWGLIRPWVVYRTVVREIFLSECFLQYFACVQLIWSELVLIRFEHIGLQQVVLLCPFASSCSVFFSRETFGAAASQ